MVGSFLHYLQISVQKSVGLGKVHVFQELNSQSIVFSLGCRTVQIPPPHVAFVKVGQTRKGLLLVLFSEVNQ